MAKKPQIPDKFIRMAGAVLLWLWMLCASSHQIHAANIVGFKPTLGKDIHLDTTIAAGKAKKIDYTVVNLTDAKLSLTASQDLPFGSHEPTDERSNSARSFINLPQEPLIIDPSARKYLSFNITIPANTPPGQYQSVISLLKTDSQEMLTQSRVTITVDGELKKVLGAVLSTSIIQDKINLSFDLENKGNTSIDNVVAHISLLNKNLQTFFKLPKELLIPLDLSLAVGEKATVNKLLDIPLDAWADYSIVVSLDFGSKQPVLLNTQIAYRNQSQINKYLVGAVFVTLPAFLLLIIFIKFLKVHFRQNKQSKQHYLAKQYPNPPQHTITHNQPIGITEEQMKELIAELKKELKNIIQDEMYKPLQTKNTLATRKLAKHDLMDSFQRYLNS